jgi:putative PIN family toxin of toxin-antitoxin system
VAQVVLHHRFVTSRYILNEVRRHLLDRDGFFEWGTQETGIFIAKLIASSLMVKPAALPRDTVPRDADDVPVLGTAVAGRCQLLITGDSDLLSLKRYKHLRIVDARSDLVFLWRSWH